MSAEQVVADPACPDCHQVASEHSPLGGFASVTAQGAGQSRQQPGSPRVCGRPRWEVHAAAVRAQRCAVVVETERFTWECLRDPHEHHPDQHVMAVAP